MYVLYVGSALHTGVEFMRGRIVCEIAVTLTRTVGAKSNNDLIKFWKERERGWESDYSAGPKVVRPALKRRPASDRHTAPVILTRNQNVIKMPNKLFFTFSRNNDQWGYNDFHRFVLKYLQNKSLSAVQVCALYASWYQCKPRYWMFSKKKERRTLRISQLRDTQWRGKLI